MGDYLAELVEGQSSLNQHHSGTLETSFDGDCVSGSVERDDYRACRLEEARNARNARARARHANSLTGYTTRSARLAAGLFWTNEILGGGHCASFAAPAGPQRDTVSSFD
jgi:hypothetical protein